MASFALAPSSSSRSTQKPASLPSISPAWMPPSASSTGRFFAWLALGSKVPSALATSASIGRPCGVWPNFSQRTRPG